MAPCLADNASCQWNGSKYCCSTNCIQLSGQEYGYCGPRKQPTTTTTPSTRSSSTSAKSCLPHGARCHYSGSLGNCCSFHCNQLEGAPFGTCEGSSPPTKIPPKCLDDHQNCTTDGSMGFCCSRYCDVLAPHTIGRCRISLDGTSSGHSWIVYASVTIPLAVIITATLIWLYFRQRKLERGLSKAETRHFFHGDPESMHVNGYAHENAANLPYNKELEIPDSDYDIDKGSPLGSGCFGLVLRGKVKGVEVAVKTIRATDSGSHLRALLTEIKILQYIGNSENIVSMVGSNTSGLETGKVYLFLEFCPLGNLEKYLRTNKYAFVVSNDSPLSQSRNYQNIPGGLNTVMSHDDLLTWCIQITNAMRYLANKKVIHADIATRNVLLMRKDCAKLTDFGLSRRLYDYSNYVKRHQEPLPWRWMAIESLQQLSFSHQSDVWSLGITFWEIYTLGDTPYPGLSWTDDFVHRLENNLRPMKPFHASLELYDLMLDCWKPSPETRPTFNMICRKLHEIQKYNG